MLIALIGDVAGNFSALNAAIDAIEEAGIQTIMQAGAVAVGPRDPNSAVQSLRESGIHCVLSQDDRALVQFQKKARTLERRRSPEAFENLRDAHEAIRPENLEWLQTLPRQRRLHIDGIDIFLSAGAPGAPNRNIDADTPDQNLQRYREETNAQLILTGGPGPAFSRQVADTLFVHPGPVCIDEGQAAYTIIDTESATWTAEVQIIHYNDAEQ